MIQHLKAHGAQRVLSSTSHGDGHHRGGNTPCEHAITCVLDAGNERLGSFRSDTMSWWSYQGPEAKNFNLDEFIKVTVVQSFQQ
jgi:hypothetical protein